MNGEEGLECEVHVDGIRLEHVSEFKCLGVVWTNQAQIQQSVIERWIVGGKLQARSGPYLMLGICSLSVLESLS